MKRKREIRTDDAKAFAKFGRLMLKHYLNDGWFFDREESEAIMAIAEDCGLSERVAKYDPEKHGEIDDIWPGEAFWRWTP